MIDNTSAVGAFRKGSSRKADINAIVGSVWMLSHRHHIEIFIHWVPSKYNIADLPSRGRPPAVASAAQTDVNWDLVRSSMVS